MIRKYKQLNKKSFPDINIRKAFFIKTFSFFSKIVKFVYQLKHYQYMKKIFTLLFTGLSTCALAQEQLSNPGFENWTLTKPAYNYYAPNDWMNGTACASINGGEEQCTFALQRVTDAHSGNYAVAMYNKEEINGSVSYMSFGNMGVGEGLNGPDFTGRPESFSFYYKYATDDNQQMNIKVILYAGDISSPEVVGVGTGEYSITSSASEYTLAETTIAYASDATPDKIVITVNYEGTPSTAYDTLKLDDFTFKYATTSTTDNKFNEESLKISVVDKYLTTSKAVSGVRVIDLSGNTVTSFDKEGSEFNVSVLNSGMYIMVGNVNGQPFKRRLVIN